MAAVLFLSACGGPQPAKAAPYAAHVMDARTGETLHSDNADTRLHPASLTKMMTLYIAFEEIERGNLSLDTMVTVSKNAAAQPPSRLGLKAGQKIALRYLIRAAAVKSANDAAQAIGDYIGGDQASFATRMTRTAKALGMKNSTFKNASGLTAKGHLSTAHDMSILGRHLFYDFPQYYNIFSRRTTDAGLAEVANTNRKFLEAYRGADGIKTGYTGPAGFNLTASAERGGVRIIATVFGGSSTADRNAKAAKLLDLGFSKAPKDAQTVPPVIAPNADIEGVARLDEALPEVEDGAAKTVRVVMSLDRSPRPMARPEVVEAAEVLVAEMAGGIEAALMEANLEPPPEGTLEAQVVALNAGTDQANDGTGSVDAQPQDVLAIDAAVASAGAVSAPDPDEPMQLVVTASAEQAEIPDLIAQSPRPKKKKAPVYETAVKKETAEPVEIAEAEVDAPLVLTRVSTSGGAHWGITIGKFASQYAAQQQLAKVQLKQNAVLGESLRKIQKVNGGFDANFLGLTREQADIACAQISARGESCIAFGP